MEKRIPVEDLKPGMFIKLERSWFKHPFLRSQFCLESQDQVREILKAGIKSVLVDIDRSIIDLEEHHVHELCDVDEKPPVQDSSERDAPVVWTPETLVSAELKEAIESRHLSSEAKSQIVYQHTLQMMQRLLETPSVENLACAKENIVVLTDMILREPETAFGMLKISEHDFYTYTHSVNVGVMGTMMSQALLGHSDGHDMHELSAGFFLHDLGKVKVMAEIINKPGRLTEKEMQHMRRHPYQGYKILEEAGLASEEVRIIVMEHHELFDGTGYPKRLSADQIHLYGRMCCLVDVFDAMTAERSYKKAMSPYEALSFMRDNMKNYFDNELFRSFVGLFQH